MNDAVALHGRMLADPDFYEQHGNHALNQDIGLLEVGCWLGRHDWMDLAQSRISSLIRESVDVQGVTNEESVQYEKYNYQRYSLARIRLSQCGFRVPRTFARVDRMPAFLAQATLPNGYYVTLGSGLNNPSLPIPGTDAEFAATQGRSGREPDRTIAEYASGFVFGRTGWGDSRPFADEDAFSLRFGPPPRVSRPRRRGSRHALWTRAIPAHRSRDQGLQPR